MPKAHLYKIKDIRTGEYLPGVYRATDVVRICGIKSDVSGYAKRGYTFMGKWKIEFSDGSEAYDSDYMDSMETRWAK